MSDMDKAVYDSKKALPNKLLKEDGSVTDLAGNVVIGAVDAYDNKPALPNKWLNPDGSYSTLNEIVASMIDNDLFIIVDELPAVGEENKIYLLTQDDKLIEYIWVNNKWDPVGMVEFDIDNYYTKAEVTQLITASLNSAKAYAKALFDSIEIDPQVFYWDGKTDATGLEFWNKIYQLQKTTPCIVFTRYSSAGANYVTQSWYYNNDMPISTVDQRVKSVYTDANFGTESRGPAFGMHTILKMWVARLSFTIENDNITNITYFQDQPIEVSFLSTTVNYVQPYVPQYNGSPATKKYVDDTVTDAIDTNITQVLNGSY